MDSRRQQIKFLSPLLQTAQRPSIQKVREKEEVLNNARCN